MKSLEVGEFLGEYEILEHMPKGGMSIILRARHRLMNRVAIIKVANLALGSEDRLTQMFRREIEASARISHENVLTVFDAAVVDGLPYLVTEYIPGGDLHDYVANKGPCSVRQAIDYTIQAASGLQVIHDSGIIHRDVKPANLLIDETGMVHVMDFGISKLVEMRQKESVDLRQKMKEKFSPTARNDAKTVPSTPTGPPHVAPTEIVTSRRTETRASWQGIARRIMRKLRRPDPHKRRMQGPRERRGAIAAGDTVPSPQQSGTDESTSTTPPALHPEPRSVDVKRTASKPSRVSRTKPAIEKNKATEPPIHAGDDWPTFIDHVFATKAALTIVRGDKGAGQPAYGGEPVEIAVQRSADTVVMSNPDARDRTAFGLVPGSLDQTPVVPVSSAGDQTIVKPSTGEREKTVVKPMPSAWEREEPVPPADMTVPVTAVTSVVGTPAYASPEQWADVNTIDLRTDIYSLGCTLFYLLTGEAIVDGGFNEIMEKKRRGEIKSPLSIRPDIPPGLDQVVRKMTARSPSDRYGSMEDVRTMLEKVGVQPKVFISYRREDTLDATDRLYMSLSKSIDSDLLFMDIDSIPTAVDFREHIAAAVADCDMLLAIVGDHWLEPGARNGKRRIDDPADFVRLEIEAALLQDIPVVPVLVGTARMPGVQDLPEELEAFAYKNATEVRPGSGYESHIDRLVRDIYAIWKHQNAPEGYCHETNS